MAASTGTLSRRDLLRMSAAAGAGLALPACDVAGSDTGPRGDSEHGRVKALFMQQAGYAEADIQAMTSAFRSAHPHVAVETTFVAYEALHDKIVAAAPAGTFDVVLVDVVWMAEFATKRIIADVTGQFPAAWQTDLLSGALATAGHRGRYYGVPWIMDTKYLYANTDMLTRAGVDPATLSTWDGVLSAARRLREQRIVEYPLIWSWKQAEALICDYAQLVGAFGGRFLSENGTTPLFNTGGGLHALTFMKQTLDSRLTNPNSIESLEEDVRRIFSDGQAALALNWTYLFSAANDQKQSRVAGSVGITPTPSGPAGAPGVNGSMALAVSAGSRNRQAAWTYLTYLTSPAVQERYAASSLPCWSKSYDSPQVTAALPQVVPIARRQLGNLVARPQVPRYNEVSQILQVALQNALLGRKSPQQALDSAADQARGLLS